MKSKDELFAAGVALMEEFCTTNRINVPSVVRLKRTDRLYHLATCAYYRHTEGITIMVEKCANYGYGGRAWSWPGYVIDRTPYGVIQHELAHHVDHLLTNQGAWFSRRVHDVSQEKPLTGYLGTDKKMATFYQEWFAENFRLYVTNPDLCECLRPGFCRTMRQYGFKPVVFGSWRRVLDDHRAPERIVMQAQKKCHAVAQG